MSFSEQLGEAIRSKKRGPFVAQVRAPGGEWFEVSTTRTMKSAEQRASHMAAAIAKSHFDSVFAGSSRWSSGSEPDIAHRGMGLGKGDANFVDVEWRAVGPDGEAGASGWRHAFVPEGGGHFDVKHQGPSTAGRYKGPKHKLKVS